MTVRNALRIAKAAGGEIFSPSAMAFATTHAGPIHSAVAGRTDHLPMKVKPGSYVFPADIVSAIGEGNTMAGFKIIKSIFTTPDYTGGTPYDEKGAPYGADKGPYGEQGNPYGASPGKAKGGSAGHVDIIAAGGEHVFDPAEVERIGKGSLDDGHKILDLFVKQLRARTVKTLSKLPGPRRD